MGRSDADLLRGLLMPLAEIEELDVDAEIIDPGHSEAAQAFQLLFCGAMLLLGYCDKETFPAGSKRTARRGAKWLTQDFTGDMGRRAANFLAHALGLLFAEAVTRAGDPESGEIHREQVEVLDSHFPLPDEERPKLDACLREYRVMDTHEVPEAVRHGIESGTAYHTRIGLREQAENPDDDPELVDPDDDPEIVEIQRRHAQAFFKSEAGLAAIEMVIGPDRYAEIEDDIIHSARTVAGEGILQELDEGELWSDAAARWRDAVDRNLSQAQQVERIAVSLTHRALSFLLDPERTLATGAWESGDSFAHELSTSRSEYNLALDAILFGCGLFEAEAHLSDSLRTIDPANLDRFRALADDDPSVALGVGAEQVAENMPAPFSFGSEIWEQVEVETMPLLLARQEKWIEAERMDRGANLPDVDRLLGVRLGYGIAFTASALGLPTVGPSAAGARAAKERQERAESLGGAVLHEPLDDD